MPPTFTDPLESTILPLFPHSKYIDHGYISGHNSKTPQILYKKLTFPDHTSSLMPSTFEEFNLFHILSVFFSTNQDYDHLLNRRNPPHQRDAGVSKPPQIRRIWDETEGFYWGTYFQTFPFESKIKIWTRILTWLGTLILLSSCPDPSSRSGAHATNFSPIP